MSPVACNDDWDDKLLQSGVGIIAIANQNYRIEVAEFAEWIDAASASYPVDPEFFDRTGRILNLNVVVGIISEVETYIGGVFLGKS